MQKQKGFAPIMILVGILVVMAVAGGAYFLGKQATPKISPPVQPTTVSQPSPISNETANWKTYTNTKYNFQVKFPSDWITLEGPDPTPIVRFIPSQLGVKSLEEYNKLGLETVKKWPDIEILLAAQPFKKATKEDEIQNGINFDWKNITVGGVEGVAYQIKQCTACPYEVKLPYKDGTGTFIVALMKTKDEDRKIFDQILSTFKFTQ